VSHRLALLFTVAVIAAMILEERNDSHEAAMNNPAIQLELAPDPAPPAPKVPEPPVPQPPKPLPVRKKEAVHHEVPASLPLMAETAETPAVNDLAGPPQDAESEAPAASDRAAAGTIEAQYAATLRSNIDARTVVPESIEYRLRRPKGETRVNFTLDREGSVLEARVARTSGSEILDHQALRIVKAGQYPPFPQTAFRGELRHSFLVTLEFHL
jgi:periplasmic protein TonB